MSKKIRIFLVGCMLMVMCCLGFTAGASDNAKAEVVAHNLTITDEGINVNFYVDIQGDVQITLNNQEVDKPQQTEKIVIDAKAYDCYKFTQPVVAKEMDQDVSLVIKSGDDTIVADDYCVNDYATSVINEQYNNFKYEELVKAMTYYGDFAEKYLKYEASQDEENAAAFLGKFDDEAKADLVSSKYALVKGELPEELGIAPSGIQLNLISEVSIRLSFTVTDEDKALGYEFTAVSGDVTKELGTLKKGKYNGAPYYYVDIENIGADELDAAYDIKVGNTTVLSNCSALSYARAVVGTYENNAEKADLVNLAKALYLYNKKAETYVASQATAVLDIFYGSEGFSATPGSKTAVYYTADGDVTREATGNTVVTKLSDLNGKNIRGCSVWMETAYPVSGTEELTGPYVVRRYKNNEGSLLNVSGEATLTATVDASTGDFAARHPGVPVDEFSISKEVNNEVSVSGTLNVTGSAKTGVITVANGNSINAEGLTAEGAVVFASHEGVNLSGNADVSAITLLDDGMGHFDIVKHNDNVRVASVICVCGDDVTDETEHACPWTENVDNIVAVYDIAWEPHTGDDGMLPGHNQGGYYYLTKPITLTTRTEVKLDTTCVDLNGQIVTGWNGRLIGLWKEYSIADSKGGAGIKLPSGYTSSTNYGGMISIADAQATLSIYGGTIDMSAASTVTQNIHLIDIATGGTLAMHGGTIIPAQDGKGIGIRNGHLVATGGTIFGEVIYADANSNSTIKVEDGAQVGVVGEEGDWLQDITYHGINPWYTATLNCNNLNETAKIDLKSKVNFTLTENENSNSVASAITLLDDGMGHFGVVKQNGKLRFASVICACGEDVTGKDSHICPWTGNVEGIANVYDIQWKAYNDDNGCIPGYNTTGYYYLTKNITLTQGADVTSTNSHLDLNGKNVICSSSSIHIRMYSASARYAISDSKGEGAIQFSENYPSNTAGAMIQGYYSKSIFTMYSGTIDMTNASSTSLTRPIDMAGGTGSDFIMYGGVIKPTKEGHSIYVRESARVKILGNGTVYGKITLTASAVLTVGESANVGLQWEDFGYYGIAGESGGTRQIVCDNLNKNANIVIESEENLSVTEKEGSNSVLTRIKADDGHTGVIKESGSLRFVSVICACGEDVTGKDSHICPWTGNVEGIANVYDIQWKAYNDDNGCIPGYDTTGYYYLTKNITLTQGAKVTSTNSHLDLNGKNVICSSSSIHIRMSSDSARYAISDSKGEGAIQFSENYSSNTAGAMIQGYYSKSIFTMYSGTIDMTNASSTSLTRPIDMAGGTGSDFIMYGGVIKPTKEGHSIYVRESARVKILGNGTVYGKITLTASAVLTVGESANVGLQWEDFGYYGIVGEAGATRQIICDNLNKNANIVIESKENLSLSEKAGSNSLASVFTVVNEGKDGHYGVVKKSDGTLAFGTVICVCGEDVSDTPTHTCAWVNAQSNKINDVYSISWQEYTATTGTLPGTSTAGYYYLTDNFTASRSDVTVESYLDLNGYTVTTASSASWTIRLETSSSSYTITDSKGKGTMQFSENYIPAKWGSMVLLNNAGKFTMYGGTIDMTNATASPYTPIDVNNSQFFMYGGVIKPVENRTENSNCIGTRNSGTINVMGGTIYGEVLLSSASGRLNVGGDAQVGIPFGNNENYSIKAWSAETQMFCDNVQGTGTMYINNPDRMSLSGTGEASAFVVMDNEYVVVNTADGLAIQKKNSGE